MSFVDLLYRCPICGADGMEEHGSRGARCDACERVFEHVPEIDGVHMVDANGSQHTLDLAEMIANVSERDTSGEDAGTGIGEGPEASVVTRFARNEKPVRYRDALLGFVERRGSPRAGTLRLAGDTLEFTETAGRRHVWPLLDLRAVQTASSALQISPLRGGVVTFAMVDDSPRRWEDLLRDRLKSAWRSAERGEIIEFQPRIRTR